MHTFEDHFEELRERLFNALVVFTVFTAAAFYFSGDILGWLQADLGFTLNALTAYEVFYTQIMIAVLAGFFGSLPFLLYQLLKFAQPGLKDHEYRVLRNYLPFSLLLFGLGAAFGYNYVVRLSLAFFSNVTQSADVTALWGLKNTLGFALKISAFTGLIFQLPVISVILGRLGIIDATDMREYRAYFLVAVLVTSALATPPDIVTQVMVTVPVIALYQVSIWLVDRTSRKA